MIITSSSAVCGLDAFIDTVSMRARVCVWLISYMDDDKLMVDIKTI